MSAARGVVGTPSLSQPKSDVFTEDLCATIWTHFDALSKALRSHDPSEHGTVTPRHFVLALEAMNESLEQSFVPLTTAQITKLVSSLPLDADGSINYKEFRSAFEIFDERQEL